jgi:hypothetical protein
LLSTPTSLDPSGEQRRCQPSRDFFGPNSILFGAGVSRVVRLEAKTFSAVRHRRSEDRRSAIFGLGVFWMNNL